MELIERIIKQNPWWNNKEIESIKNLKKRELFDKLLEYKNNKQIISVIGLRRVGKTTLLYQLIQEFLKKIDPKKIIYFSFDELLGKDPEVIEKVLETYEQEILKDELKEVYVFFDEINHVKDWQVVLKRYYDLGKIKFFISGSSSILLKKSKESLAGRIYEFTLRPLTFKEYLYLKNIEIKNFNTQRLTIKKELNNYLLNGAFPEIIEEKNFEKINAYVKSVTEKIIFYDLPKVYDIGEPAVLNSLFEVIAKNPGSLIEYKNLASTFNISYQTVSKYLNYLEKSFLIKFLYNYRGSPVARARKLKKAYLSTPSLSLSFLSENEFLQLIPKLVENLVITHLNSKFFWKKYYEVDLLHNNLPIEVKYRESPKIKGALETAKELNSKKLLIITKDFEEIRTINKISTKHIPLWKFLLSNSIKS